MPGISSTYSGQIYPGVTDWGYRLGFGLGLGTEVTDWGYRLRLYTGVTERNY